MSISLCEHNLPLRACEICRDGVPLRAKETDDVSVSREWLTELIRDAHRYQDALKLLEVTEKENAKLRDEMRRLHQCLRNVYEVWAGSEGIPAPTKASEAYLLSLVEKMRDAAKEGLK